MKAAVIGAGRISRQHLACLRKLAGVEVAAVCDLSRVSAEAAAERFAIRRWYTDHRRMLLDLKPDVVHVTTPPASHFTLAMDALDGGAHVILEKPATVRYDEVLTLVEHAESKDRVVVEDYNYLFNPQTQKILSLIADGSFGAVAHVEVIICLDILGPGGVFADPNAPSPFLAMDGGAIADFLPHLAALAHAFVGEHRSVSAIWSKRGAGHPLPSDEFRALVEAERGTAMLAFSAHAQPDIFEVRVYGSKMRAVANLFEPRLTIDRLRDCPRPLAPLLNGMEEAKRVRRAAYGGLWGKLGGGPGAYEGLWELVRRTYAAIAAHEAAPVTSAQIRSVNRLVHDLKKGSRP